MSNKRIPNYEIISYSIEPPFASNRFGAKPKVFSSYDSHDGDPWNKEFWGKTEEEAISKAKTAVEKWINELTT